MVEKRTKALAEVAQLETLINSTAEQLTQAKVDLEAMRGSADVHKQRANTNDAGLTAARKKYSELSARVVNMEQTVGSTASQIAVLSAEKEHLIKRECEIEEESQPLRQRQTKLDTEVQNLRELNLVHNLQLQKSQGALDASQTTQSEEVASLAAAKNAKIDVEHHLNVSTPQLTATLDAVAKLQEQVQALSKAAEQARLLQAQEEHERQETKNKNTSLAAELKTLRAHSNMSAAQQKDALAQCERRCCDLRTAEANLLQETSAAEKDVSSLQSTLDISTARVKTLDEEHQRHAQILQKLRTDIDARVATLEAQVEQPQKKRKTK